MTFTAFSPKQLKVLTWWCRNSVYKDRDAIICDGAVRSGKTMCMSVSFIAWAMGSFNKPFRDLFTALKSQLPEYGKKRCDDITAQ